MINYGIDFIKKNNEVFCIAFYKDGVRGRKVIKKSTNLLDNTSESVFHSLTEEEHRAYDREADDRLRFFTDVPYTCKGIHFTPILNNEVRCDLLIQLTSETVSSVDFFKKVGMSLFD